MSLFEAVRKACPSGLWSQGVKLARDGAVLVESESDAEVTLRVRAPRFAVPPTVTLYPADEEWSCDCGGKIDPCEHVAAAAIAIQNRAPSEGTRPVAARLGYRLERQDKSLYLRRVIVHPDGREEPLRGALSSLVAKGAGALVPSHDDLALDRLLGGAPRPFLPTVRMEEILASLSTSTDVTLDGAPVKTAGEPVAPRARVIDADDGGVLLRIERHPCVDEVVARGVVRVSDRLRPLREVELTGELLEKLPRVRSFDPSRFPELATEVLPALEERIDVTIESKRLPRAARSLKPRVLLELGQRAGGLSVVPLIVYGDPPHARVDGDRLVHLAGDVPVRDETAERRLVQRLRDELNLVPGRRVDFEGRDAQQFATRLEAWAVHDPEQAILSETQLSPRLEATDERFDVVFEANGKRASAEAVVRAWRDGYGLVPLEGGGFARLPSAFLEKHGRRVADLLAARDEQGKLPNAAAPQLVKLCADLGEVAPPSFARLASTLASFERIPRAELPEGFRAELRPYQRAGVDWLCFLRDVGLGAVLADDMGLGKTVQTIAVLRGRALVVCPKSVVHNWAAELAKFRPGLRVALHHGPRRSFDREADVTIVTYAVLRLDAELFERETFDVVVLDEAQAIKNPDSQTARAAFRLRAGFRVALSGTPVENRLDELWSVFRFASPGLLGDRTGFAERFADPIARGESGAAERLREIVRPFLLRRLKRDVAPELPPRTDVVLRVELDEKERAVYDAVRAATRKDVLEKLQSGGSVLAALEALLRLRQAACHSALVPGQRAEGSSKVEALIEALVDASSDGHKALVFSQWTSMLDLVEPHLGSAGIPFVRLDGSTVDRGAVVSRFSEEAGPPVMLVSLKAGGTGLNLVAADHVFLLDPWWNPAVEEQAADRAHRIGQDKPVFVYRLVAKDTVEEGILALQEKKRAIAEAALEGGDRAAAITRDELLALLS